MAEWVERWLVQATGLSWPGCARPGSNPTTENFALELWQFRSTHSVYPALPVSFGGDTKSRRSLKITLCIISLSAHSIEEEEVERRPVLRPERSLPHRPPTRIIIIIYKLTVLSIYSMLKVQ